MPIAHLAESATRAITSTLVLHDAVSVVKELLDNALDSHADNITIEISQNTLDTIQLKDNGSGIGVEDRLLLCKRGYTSKIRTLEDLEHLGGSFLGFRGEALASIAELSVSTAITTRIDGELVATNLKFDSTGQLINSTSASHGTGTTVRVENFLNKVPVRKQTAQKNAARTLNNMKHMLMDYAFARPTIRIAFRVLKSKPEFKGNFSYSSCKDEKDLTLVTSKVLGTNVAKYCKSATIENEDDKHKINALMLAPETDELNTNITGQYISINGRPLSIERGLGKDLAKMYKTYLRSVLLRGLGLPQKPFLALQLNCPAEDYDVNIEPAKNEVLFNDVGKVLDLFQDMCRQVYGEKEANEKIPDTRKRPRTAGESDFSILLARPMNSGHQSATPALKGATEKQSDDLRAREAEQTSPMVHTPKELDNVVVDMAGNITDPQITNPFMLAAINTRVKPVATPLPMGESMFDSSPNLPPPRHQLPLSPDTSPARSQNFQNPGPPNRPWKSGRSDAHDAVEELSGVAKSDSANAEDSNLFEQRVQNVSRTPATGTYADQVKTQKPQLSSIPPRPQGYGNWSRSLSGSPVPARSRLPLAQQGFGIPFTKQARLDYQDRQQSQEGISSRTVLQNASTSPTRITLPSSSSSLIEGPQLPGFSRPRAEDLDLSEIMEFETRKQQMALQHRKQKRQTKLPLSSQTEEDTTEKIRRRMHRFADDEEEDIQTDYAKKFSGSISRLDDVEVPPQPNSAGHREQNPHMNRRNKALEDLATRGLSDTKELKSSISTGEKSSTYAQIGLNPKDPRAYLLRLLQRDDLDHDIARGRTKHLPFESIPSEFATYQSSVQVGSEIADVSKHIDALKMTAVDLSTRDMYTQSGVLSGGLLNEISLDTQSSTQVSSLPQTLTQTQPPTQTLDQSGTQQSVPQTFSLQAPDERTLKLWEIRVRKTLSKFISRSVPELDLRQELEEVAVNVHGAVYALLEEIQDDLSVDGA